MGPNNVSDEDKKFLYQILAVIAKNFGTADLEWYCSAEAVLNAMFELKSKNT